MVDIPGVLRGSGASSVARSWVAGHNREYSPQITAGIVAAIDIFAILLAASFAFMLALGVHAPDYERYLYVSMGAAALILTALYHLELYDFDVLEPPHGQLGKIIIASGLPLFIWYVITLTFSTQTPYQRSWWYTFVCICIAAICIERWVVYRALLHLARSGAISRNVVVVGDGPQRDLVLETLRDAQRPWIRTLGVFDNQRDHMAAIPRASAWLGAPRDLVEFARHVRVDDVVLVPPQTADPQFTEAVHATRSLAINLQVSASPPFRSLSTERMAWRNGAGFLTLSSKPLDGWGLALKLIEDKLIAASVLLFLLPLFALIALAIKLDSPGPVFFCQRRIGFNNKVIEVYKFRTMFHAHRDRDGESLTTKSDPRVTSVGRFLRRTSADELPQLLNVLMGSMSIVGPRPHAIRARAGGKLYGEAVPRYAERHKVKPGITGWAQVNGWRGETATEEELRRRIECDIYYLENWSILFDLRIMLRTIIAIIAGKGAY